MRAALRSRRWGRLALEGLWALLLVSLPITSSPLLTGLTGASVAPFAAIPLALLAAAWLVPHLARGGSLPKEGAPLAALGVVALGLAGYAFFQEAPLFRDRPMLAQTVRAFVPFVTGLGFFFVASAWPADSAALRRSLRWIHVGGMIMLAYTALQALVVFAWDEKYPAWLDAARSLVVTQSNFEGYKRLVGLAWEASWFANQLNMLYLPLWLAASYQRTSVFPKLWKISVENILLVLGMVAFFFASPRIGAAGCMLMLLALFIKLNLALYRWILRRTAHLWSAARRPRLVQAVMGLAVGLAMLGAYAGFSYALLKVVSTRDWRVALLMNKPMSSDEVARVTRFDDGALMFLGYRFAFLERTVYWVTGWRIFNDYPFLGVGLGNAGYYFPAHVPAQGLASLEVRTILYQDPSLPNIKSLWYRLLAETGLLGFTLFVVWWLILWASSQAAQRSRDATLRMVALAGQLGLLAFIFEGFSIDSFGLPYLFVMTGLLAAAGKVYRGKVS